MQFERALNENKRINIINIISVACYILIVGYCIISIFLVSGLWTKSGLFYRTDIPAGADFLQIWSGSSLALSGNPAMVYNLEALKRVETAVIGGDFINYLAWHYPPSFLLLTLPLSLIPYLLALVAWIGITLAGLLVVVHIIAPHPLSIKLTLAFPATALNLFYGQGAFLITFLLGSGVLLLESSPILSGILFSLILNYKPHLGLLALVALVAGRHWKALGAVIGSTAALMLASAAVFGLETWIAFYRNIHYAYSQLEANANFWPRMPTIFATVRLQGGDVWLATVLQCIISGGAVILVCLIWRRNYPLAVRGAVLVLGTLLCSPHAFEYDLTLLVLPLAWFAWENLQSNWRSLGGLLVFLVWLSPVINMETVRIAAWHIEPLIVLMFLLAVVKLAAGMGVNFASAGKTRLIF
jgi:hypothetical protein